MLEFWRVRIGRLTVYDWSLEEALASAARVKGYAKLFRATRPPPAR
jgi:hypothetical protein